MMHTVEWYRQQADDAESVARVVSLRQDRERYFAEARRWRELADAAEAKAAAAAPGAPAECRSWLRS